MRFPPTELGSTTPRYDPRYLPPNSSPPSPRLDHRAPLSMTTTGGGEERTEGRDGGTHGPHKSLRPRVAFFFAGVAGTRGRARVISFLPPPVLLLGRKEITIRIRAHGRRRYTLLPCRRRRRIHEFLALFFLGYHRCPSTAATATAITTAHPDETDGGGGRIFLGSSWCGGTTTRGRGRRRRIRRRIPHGILGSFHGTVTRRFMFQGCLIGVGDPLRLVRLVGLLFGRHGVGCF